MQWTEKQIETWLRSSERSLIDGHGDAFALEQSQLFWKQFDFLVDNGHFTEAKLIEYGNDTVEEFGLPFALGIQDAVGHLYDALAEGEGSGQP